MKKIRKKYLGYLNNVQTPKIVDVGGMYDVPHKTYLRIFEDIPDVVWNVCDVVKHTSVTHVMPGPYTLPFEDNSIDLVVSGQMLEHCDNPFKSVTEMKRIIKPKHYIVIIAPSAGPYHTNHDCWRFLGDAWSAIANDVGLKIIDQWITIDAPDERSRKWRDNVFVGMKEL